MDDYPAPPRGRYQDDRYGAPPPPRGYGSGPEPHMNGGYEREPFPRAPMSPRREGGGGYERGGYEPRPRYW